MLARSAEELVMADLVDALIQENLFGFADATSDGQWLHVPPLRLRVRSGGHLQALRFAGSVWHGDDRIVEPAALMELLLDGRPEPGGQRVLADLRSAVEHADVTLRGFASLPDRAPKPGGVLAGERLAATRDRPFHPTARASTGWTAQEQVRFGPMRSEPLSMHWVAVRRDLLRVGSDGSSRLHELVLDDHGRPQLSEMLAEAGVDLAEFQPLPVHPWQSENVLPGLFDEDLRSGAVVRLRGSAGRFLPTASLRTLVTVPEGPRHLKLPLGVSTLGAARLLPPRYLGNSDRAQRTVEAILERDADLARVVQVCTEDVWSAYEVDEADPRHGQLAAQVRSLPADVFDGLVLPMAALCAHEWDLLHSALSARASGGRTEFALSLFTEVAGAFCRMAFGLLRYGVLPELHGQNVLVRFTGTGVAFVLRDHDTLRLHPAWMAAAGVADPRYRVDLDGPQTLVLSTPEALVGYLQTLGFQVNLYGIVSALAPWAGLDETPFWCALRGCVESALADLTLPDEVAEVLEREILRSPTWPSRQVLGPLIRQAPRGEVSMPAATGVVPNPLTGTRRSG